VRAAILVCVVCLAVSAVGHDANADIAPMPHPGYSLAPEHETRVSMARERVDIRIGDRPDPRYYTHLAYVSAEFEMVNETPDTITLDVGFPVEASFIGHSEWAVEEFVNRGSGWPHDADSIMAHDALEKFHDSGYYQFRVSIDGGEEFAPDAVKSQGLLRRGAYEPRYLWFHWGMSFPPGTTRVTTTYRVPSIYTKGSGYQNVAYVLHTGSYWSGPIGSAIVAVHFPEWAPAVQPTWKTTPGYERTTHTVTWRFSDFEPAPDNDIKIEFISPDAARAIYDLCRHLDAHPDDADAMVELARLHMDVTTLAADWPGHPDYAGSAGPLLERALEIDPASCLVWNVYLAWYHGWQGSRFGMAFHRLDEISPKQSELAAHAHDACPDDSVIAAWYDLLTPERWRIPDVLGFIDTSRGRPELWYENYHAGHTQCLLSDDGPVIVEACYQASSTRPGDWIIYTLRDHVSDEARRAMHELLEKCSYFQRNGVDRAERSYRNFDTANPIAIKRPREQ
jgi:hypothetical protein